MLSGRGCQGQGPPELARAQAAGDVDHDDYEMLVMLMTENPIVVSCIRTIQSACLDQGIQCSVAGEKVSSAFAEFVRDHYTKFCEHAIRSIFMCGFVPWRLRRLETGDCVPEVLPLGTFSWSVEEQKGKQKQRTWENHSSGPRQNNASHGAPTPGDKRKHPGGGGEGESNQTGGPGKKGAHDKKGGPEKQPLIFMRQQSALRKQYIERDSSDTQSLRYKIEITKRINVTDKEVEIYEYFQPTSLPAWRVSSPMAGILTLYKEIVYYRGIYQHAESWNTQAKLLCSYTPAKDMYGVHEGNPITQDWDYPQRMGLNTDTNLPVEFEENMLTRDNITEALVGSKAAVHPPLVYSLPKNTVLQAVPKLDCIRKVEDMEQRFAIEVSNLMGVPIRSEANRGLTAASEGNISMTFTSMVRNLCHHMQEVLKNVYIASYGASSEVRFTISPSSRLGMQSIDDFIKLLDHGLVSAKDAYSIGNMITSSELMLCTGRAASAGQGQQLFETPQNTQDRRNTEISSKKVDQDRAKARLSGTGKGSG